MILTEKRTSGCKCTMWCCGRSQGPREGDGTGQRPEEAWAQWGASGQGVFPWENSACAEKHHGWPCMNTAPDSPSLRQNPGGLHPSTSRPSPPLGLSLPSRSSPPQAGKPLQAATPHPLLLLPHHTLCFSMMIATILHLNYLTIDSGRQGLPHHILCFSMTLATMFHLHYLTWGSWGQGLPKFCLQLHPCHLQGCLAHSGDSAHILWIKMNDVPVNCPLGKSTRLSQE